LLVSFFFSVVANKKGSETNWIFQSLPAFQQGRVGVVYGSGKRYRRGGSRQCAEDGEEDSNHRADENSKFERKEKEMSAKDELNLNMTMNLH